jgi:hypothetical protein
MPLEHISQPLLQGYLKIALNLAKIFRPDTTIITLLGFPRSIPTNGSAEKGCLEVNTPIPQRKKMRPAVKTGR